MKLKRKKGHFSISTVAKMLSVHQQTIRLYEKQGLISPKRSTGNTRLFSDADIEQLEEIIHLTHQVGINIAGVEMILKLKKQIHKMQRDMNKIFTQTQKELDQETVKSKLSINTNSQRLLQLKQEKQSTESNDDSDGNQTIDIDNWEIEYDQE